jgi:hypothetical protein
MAVLAFGVLGCSTHPLPQDVSGVSTVDIVKKIRCEAKDGLQAALAKAASQSAASKRHVEQIVSVSTIGFEFNFVMTEDNAAHLSTLSFERASATAGDGFKLIVVGDIAADPKAKDSPLSRTNTRTFRVVDKLDDLRKAHCGRVKGTLPNLIYPITGSTGMAEVVRTYIELETFTNLDTVTGTTATAPRKNEIVTFSDKLDFTTTFDAGASLDLKFDTAVGSLRLTRATISGSAYRQDVHSVTVALARDKDAHPDLVIPLVRSGRRVGSLPVEQIRDKYVRENLAQRDAPAHNRVLLELERRRIVDEDRAVAERVLGVPVP